MPSSSAKRRSARKREPTSRQRTNAVATNNESPSRPAKRRKVMMTLLYRCLRDHADSFQTANAPTRPQPEPETEPVQDHIDDVSSDEDRDVASDPIDEIVPVLKEASYPVAVAAKHANKDVPVGNTVSAYAKIAGKTWTYYVRKPRINIGRNSDQKSSASDGRSSEAPPGEEIAEIDLGPHKLVSRIHASIYYDSGDEEWHVSVIGRNGVRINYELWRRNQDTVLKSGDILLIADTEMIFVAPDVPVNIKPEYVDRLIPNVKAEEPTSSSKLAHAHPQPQPYQGPTHISPYAPTDENAQAAASIAQAAPERQTTPVKNIMQAPYLSQNTEPAPATTPVHRQAAPMDNTEQQIDYSSDAVKHTKPPLSYATLIGQAILSTPEEKISLNGIYEWIKKHFSYYRHIEQSWQVNPTRPWKTDEPLN